MTAPSPEILVQRLAVVAAAFEAAAIAVAFTDFVDFVRGGEMDQVAKLRGLIDRGGQAIGFVFAERDGRQVQIGASPLAELEHEPGIEDDLQTVIEYFRALLVEDGKAAPVAAQ